LETLDSNVGGFVFLCIEKAPDSDVGSFAFVPTKRRCSDQPPITPAGTLRPINRSSGAGGVVDIDKMD
jgi:hypothetical protein